MSPLRRRLPEPVRVALATLVAREERTMAWAACDGGHLVATDRGLWELPDAARPTLVPWEDVDRATWRDPELVVRPVPGRGPERRHRLEAPGSFPDVVRDRVTASIVVNNRYTLRAGGVVRVLGRRRVGEDLLSWQVLYDDAGTADDPLARAEAEAWLAAARRSVGQ